MASQARDGDAKASFVECARQWQELARQKEDMERNPRKMPNSNWGTTDIGEQDRTLLGRGWPSPETHNAIGYSAMMVASF
jgi:hypothetical protein